jgi:hypothetical protein
MFWRSVGISLEMSLRFLLLVAMLAAARHSIFPHESTGVLSELNSPIGPPSRDPTDTRPMVSIFLRNFSVMMFFAALVSLDIVRRSNRKLNPVIGRPRDRLWKFTLHFLFWLFTAWAFLRLTSAYIDLSAATGLPIWKLFVSTLPYGALEVTGICMPLTCWMVSPALAFKKGFLPSLFHALQIGTLMIAAAAVLESVYRPELIDLWFHI